MLPTPHIKEPKYGDADHLPPEGSPQQLQWNERAYHKDEAGLVEVAFDRRLGALLQLTYGVAVLDHLLRFDVQRVALVVLKMTSRSQNQHTNTASVRAAFKLKFN